MPDNVLTKVTNKVKSLLGHVDPEKTAGTSLSFIEQKRYKEYIILKQYYRPGFEGLYRSKMPTGTYLYNERNWTNKPDRILKRSFPEFLWDPFNPVDSAVTVDVAALMNECDITKIKSTKDGETEIEEESEYLHNVWKENDYKTLLRRLWETAASQRDAYPRAINTDAKGFTGRKMEYKVKLLLYPPEQVFPVINQFDNLVADLFRIYYRQEVVQVHNADKAIYTGVEKEFYSAVMEEGSIGWIDDEKEEEFLHPDLGVIPMVHFAHNQGNEYFGRSTCEGLLDDIDHINLNLSAMWLIIKRLINPILLGKGMSIFQKKLPVPTSLGPIILPAGKDGDLVPIVVEIAQTHMAAVKDFIDHARNKMPHYKLDRPEMGKGTARPESMEAMSEGYKVYAQQMQDNYWQPFDELCNVILRLGSKRIRERRIITGDFGPVMSEGVMNMAEKVKAMVEMFGRHSALLEMLAKKIGLDDATTQEMIEKMKEEDERAATTPEAEKLNMTKMIAGQIVKNKDKIVEDDKKFGIAGKPPTQKKIGENAE